MRFNKKNINRMLLKIYKSLWQKGVCIIEVDDSPEGAYMRMHLKNNSPIRGIEDYEVVKNDHDYTFCIICDDKITKLGLY